MITPLAESLATRSSPPHHEPVNFPPLASLHRWLWQIRKSLECHMEHIGMTFFESVELLPFHMDHIHTVLSLVDEPNGISWMQGIYGPMKIMLQAKHSGIKISLGTSNPPSAPTLNLKHIFSACNWPMIQPSLFDLIFTSWGSQPPAECHSTPRI